MKILFLGWNRAANVPMAAKCGLKRHTGMRAQTKTIRFAYRPGSILVSTSWHSRLLQANSSADGRRRVSRMQNRPSIDWIRQIVKIELRRRIGRVTPRKPDTQSKVWALADLHASRPVLGHARRQNKKSTFGDGFLRVAPLKKSEHNIRGSIAS
ncbi:hypothetical protein PQQ96_32940 [Paraburkholderia sediminicola]|uniref:hypothetical protein n=1 Tax=Paraburkholderia sediminicola TaxID=458836 RepID=UPI0038B85AD4